MAATTRNPWIAHARPSDEAPARLFCFPYAGGNAGIYRGWGDRLPASLEVLPVELPGRASRFREPALSSVEDIVDASVEALEPFFDRPFAFFGHSMGAAISFELARRLRADGLRMPSYLFVSARRAPQVPAREDRVFDLPDEQLLAKLRELNGTPEEALQHPELMQMMLPLIRADFQVSDTHVFEDGEPLACPISGFGGLGDEEIPREDMERWGELTRGGFTLRMFPGDHFFLNHEPDRSDMLRAIAQDLSKAGILA